MDRISTFHIIRLVYEAGEHFIPEFEIIKALWQLIIYYLPGTGSARTIRASSFRNLYGEELRQLGNITGVGFMSLLLNTHAVSKCELESAQFPSIVCWIVFADIQLKNCMHYTLTRERVTFVFIHLNYPYNNKSDKCANNLFYVFLKLLNIFDGSLCLY